MVWFPQTAYMGFRTSFPSSTQRYDLVTTFDCRSKTGPGINWRILLSVMRRSKYSIKTYEYDRRKLFFRARSSVYRASRTNIGQIFCPGHLRTATIACGTEPMACKAQLYFSCRQCRGTEPLMAGSGSWPLKSFPDPAFGHAAVLSSLKSSAPTP